MLVAIVGYGRMGHEIERVLHDRGHEIVAIVDPVAPGATASSVEDAIRDMGQQSSPGTVVAIEFSVAEGVASNVSAYGRAGWSAVIGTSGWDEQRDQVLNSAAETGLNMVYGANFSVGANMFLRIVRNAARLSSATGEYDIALTELYHRGKADSPSGTGLMLADAVCREFPEKKRIQTETVHGRIDSEELHVVSARVGAVPGTHTAILDSTADTVELTHRARNRQGFAVGAVQAAEWIIGRSGVFSADSFFDDLFG